MNTKIINGQTYTESEDVEGEFILLQPKKDESKKDEQLKKFLARTYQKVSKQGGRSVANQLKKEFKVDFLANLWDESGVARQELFAYLLAKKYDVTKKREDIFLYLYNNRQKTTKDFNFDMKGKKQSDKSVNEFVNKVFTKIKQIIA